MLTSKINTEKDIAYVDVPVTFKLPTEPNICISKGKTVDASEISDSTFI